MSGGKEEWGWGTSPRASQRGRLLGSQSARSSLQPLCSSYARAPYVERWRTGSLARLPGATARAPHPPLALPPPGPRTRCPSGPRRPPRRAPAPRRLPAAQPPPPPGRAARLAPPRLSSLRPTPVSPALPRAAKRFPPSPSAQVAARKLLQRLGSSTSLAPQGHCQACRVLGLLSLRLPLSRALLAPCEAGWLGPCAPRAWWWRCCSAWTSRDRRSPRRRRRTPPVTKSAPSSRDCSPDSSGCPKLPCQVRRGPLSVPRTQRGARGAWWPRRAVVVRPAAGHLGVVGVPGAWLDLLREGERMCVEGAHIPQSHAAVREGVSGRNRGDRPLVSACFFGRARRWELFSRVFANWRPAAELVPREFAILARTYVSEFQP